MSSSYPSAPDVLPHLADEFDRPRAAWFNALFGGLRALQVELGADPSDLGTGYAANADLAALMTKLAAIEMGKFDLERPTEIPLQVKFLHPERFSSASKLIVLVIKSTTSKGRQIAEDLDHALTIDTTAGAPVGFSFYRRGMASGETLETYYYLAMEDKL